MVVVLLKATTVCVPVRLVHHILIVDVLHAVDVLDLLHLR